MTLCLKRFALVLFCRQADQRTYYRLRWVHYPCISMMKVTGGLWTKNPNVIENNVSSLIVIWCYSCNFLFTWWIKEYWNWKEKHPLSHYHMSLHHIKKLKFCQCPRWFLVFSILLKLQGKMIINPIGQGVLCVYSILFPPRTNSQLPVLPLNTYFKTHLLSIKLGISL